MAVQDYYFLLRNLSNSKKFFGYYSGSESKEYTYSPVTQSIGLGTAQVRLNAGGEDNSTNEVNSNIIYINSTDLNSERDLVNYLTRLDDLPDKGKIQLEVNDYPSYNLEFTIDSIHTGSSLSSMIISASNGSGNAPIGDSNNPISSSISQSGDPTPNINLIFTGSELRGYNEIEVTGSAVYIVASSGSLGPDDNITGSIPAPFNLPWGIPEQEFITSSFYPSSKGYAWLWNDGYKVKHIKMNNISSTGDVLSDFIEDSDWARFVMYDPVNATGSKLYSSPGYYSEDFWLYNVVKYPQNYSHLLVNQPNPLTTFAVDTSDPGNIIDTFRVTGDYVIYASSSGTPTEPIISNGIDKSIPQGYFPSSSTNYPTEQFFRGWADANYYFNGNLVGTTGILEDPLDSFYTGSTELDNDNAPVYTPSKLPFFINATASNYYIQSSSFIEYAGQSNLVQIGPSFTTEGSNEETIYYYKEDTGQIIIRGSEHLDSKKSNNLGYNPLYDIELVGPNSQTVTNYTTPEGFNIPVKPSQSLWLTRGISPIGTGDGNLYKYNRYLHRPYKAYVVTSTGSIESGYGEQNYASGSYGSGSVPVGPPPNEFEAIYMSYSSSEASARPVDGVYTFNQYLIEPLEVNASVDLGYNSIEVIRPSNYGTASYGDNEFEYGGIGSGNNVNTWQNATLKLYKNNTVFSSDSVNITPSDIENGITLNLNTTLQTYEVQVGDTLRLALEVSNESTDFNSALIANSYTMSFSNLVYPADETVPVTFDNYLELSDDCTPLINNISGDRPNERLQDVDYSVDISNPINFEQIIKDEAVRATVPESNYTKLPSVLPRYIGSSTSRRQVNEFNESDEIDVNNKFFYIGDVQDIGFINKGKGPKLGKIPNVELKNGYIAYFNKLIDPYPLVNGKTAYYVKYLIDESGQIFDPTLSDINFSLLENTFKLNDYDSTPTRAKVSLQNIEEVKELSKLNDGFSSTFKLGQYPTPILYTQTSSLGHTNNIILSGSPFFGTLGIGEGFTNYAINVNAIQSSTDFPPNSSITTVSDLTTGGNIKTTTFGDSDVTPFSQNTTPNIPTGSNSILFPHDPLAPIPNTDGAALSDDYHVDGEFIFYTSTIPAIYKKYQGSVGRYKRGTLNGRGDGTRYMLNATFQPFVKPPTSPTFSNTLNNIEVIGMTLNIIENAGLSNEIRYTPLTIEAFPNGFQRQFQVKNNREIFFRPDSRYLEKIIIQQILGKTEWSGGGASEQNRIDARKLIGGGWAKETSFVGIFGANIIYEWSLKFRLKNVKQGSGLQLQVKGEIEVEGASGRNDDYFRNHGNGGKFYKHGPIWRNTFNPSLDSGYNTLPKLKYTVTSPLANSDQNQNGALGPYWRRVSNTSDMLFMSSSILNQAYGIFDNEGNNTNGQYYVQAKLDYVGDSNINFPNTREPEFIEFDPVQDPWSLEIGDEIRFENREDLVYTITSVNGRQAIEPPTNPESTDPENEGLRIIVSPPFEFTGSNGTINTVEPTNFDFFVVRRYKENKNFIILDQQKPYGFPITGSLEPASSPGILLPEHRIEKYNRNPDEVLKDLIEKRII